MPSKIKLLFDTSRPVSWVNTAYPFSAGYLVLGGSLDLVFLIGTFFFLVPYNLLMYGINDVFDYESDIRNPRKGGVEGAVTPRKYHPLILRSSALLALPFAAYLGYAGSAASNAVLSGLLFFVAAYSVKGLRFKEIPFLDSMTSSIHFVGPLVYAMSFFAFPPETWPYVAAFFLWGMASQAFGAVQDIVPDRQAGLRSIATFLGARKTVRFSFLSYLAAGLIVLLQGGFALAVGLAGLLYVANVYPFLDITDKRSATARAGWKRFLWINYAAGAVVTIALIAANI